jgi:hypothetical protein
MQMTSVAYLFIVEVGGEVDTGHHVTEDGGAHLVVGLVVPFATGRRLATLAFQIAFVETDGRFIRILRTILKKMKY